MGFFSFVSLSILKFVMMSGIIVVTCHLRGNFSVPVPFEWVLYFQHKIQEISVSRNSVKIEHLLVVLAALCFGWLWAVGWPWRVRAYTWSVTLRGRTCRWSNWCSISWWREEEVRRCRQCQRDAQVFDGEGENWQNGFCPDCVTRGP